MALVQSKVLRIVRVKGKVGDDYTYRRRGNNLFMIKSADMSGVTWSPKQIAQRKRVADANAYARQVLADPEQAKPFLRKAKRKARYSGVNNPHALLVGEYMRTHPLIVLPAEEQTPKTSKRKKKGG